MIFPVPYMQKAHARDFAPNMDFLNLLKDTENGAAAEISFRSGPVQTVIPGNQSSVEYMK